MARQPADTTNGAQCAAGIVPAGPCLPVWVRDRFDPRRGARPVGRSVGAGVEPAPRCPLSESDRPCFQACGGFLLVHKTDYGRFASAVTL